MAALKLKLVNEKVDANVEVVPDVWKFRGYREEPETAGSPNKFVRRSTLRRGTIWQKSETVSPNQRYSMYNNNKEMEIVPDTPVLRYADLVRRNTIQRKMYYEDIMAYDKQVNEYINRTKMKVAETLDSVNEAKMKIEDTLDGANHQLKE